MSVPLVVQDVRSAKGAAPTYVDAVTGTLSANSEFRIFDAPVGHDFVLHVWQTGSQQAKVDVTPTRQLAPRLWLGQPRITMSGTSSAVVPLGEAYRGTDNRCTILISNISFDPAVNRVWVAVLRVPR